MSQPNLELAAKLRQIADAIEHSEFVIRAEIYSHEVTEEQMPRYERLFGDLVFRSNEGNVACWRESQAIESRLKIYGFYPRAQVTA